MLEDKVFSILTVLDLGQALAHSPTGFVSNNLGPGLVLAKLGIIRNGVVHVGNAALINEVNNELKLVQALEICHLRRIAGIDQGVKTCTDELNSTTTQNSLLTKEVGLGLFAESGLDNTSTTPAIGACIRQSNVTGSTRGVLVNRHKMWYPAPLGIGITHGMSRRLGRRSEE